MVNKAATVECRNIKWPYSKRSHPWNPRAPRFARRHLPGLYHIRRINISKAKAETILSTCSHIITHKHIAVRHIRCAYYSLLYSSSGIGLEISHLYLRYTTLHRLLLLSGWIPTGTAYEPRLSPSSLLPFAGLRRSLRAVLYRYHISGQRIPICSLRLSTWRLDSAERRIKHTEHTICSSVACVCVVRCVPCEWV